MTGEQRERIAGHAVLMYDGVCGLCNRVVRFCARRDRAGRLVFVPLQSTLGRELLARHGQTPEALNSAALLLDALMPGERFFHASDAVARALEQLRGPWPLLGRLMWLTPRTIRQAAYHAVGAVRYKIFGQYAECPVPPPSMRDRFLGYDDAGCQRPDRI